MLGVLGEYPPFPYELPLPEPLLTALLFELLTFPVPFEFQELFWLLPLFVLVSAVLLLSLEVPLSVLSVLTVLEAFYLLELLF